MRGGIYHIAHIFDFPRSIVTICRTGKSHNHSIIVLGNAFQRDIEVTFGFHRHIVGTVLGRFSVGSGVHAEEREVARVARPHPVVGIGTEFTDRRRGRTHHTHVVVNGDGEHEVTVTAVKGFNDDFGKRVLGEEFFTGHFTSLLVEKKGAECVHLIARLLYGFVDAVGNFLDFFDKTYL